MKTRFVSALFAGLILAPCFLIAQAPAGAPAGTTGKCKDGTYTSQATKQGACRGHKGVDTWYAPNKGSGSSAAPGAPPSAASTSPKPKQSTMPASASSRASAPPPVQTAPAAPAAEKSTTPKTAKAAAPGGGPGLVWVNSSTNVYHCYGTQFYGTTKSGKYMSEADAKAAGARPDRNKPCSAK